MYRGFVNELVLLAVPTGGGPQTAWYAWHAAGSNRGLEINCHILVVCVHVLIGGARVRYVASKDRFMTVLMTTTTPGYWLFLYPPLPRDKTSATQHCLPISNPVPFNSMLRVKKRIIANSKREMNPTIKYST